MLHQELRVWETEELLINSIETIRGLRGYRVQSLLQAAKKEAGLMLTWNSLFSEGDKSSTKQMYNITCVSERIRYGRERE